MSCLLKQSIVIILIVCLLAFSLVSPVSRASQNVVISVNPTVGTPQSQIEVTLSNCVFDPNGDTYSPDVYLYLQRASEESIFGERVMLGPLLDSTGWIPMPWTQTGTNTWRCTFVLPDNTLCTEYGFFSSADKIVAAVNMYGIERVVAVTSFSMTHSNTSGTSGNSPSANKHLPVIIIPGVGGSELDVWQEGTSNEIWPAPSGTKISQLITSPSALWQVFTKVDMSVLRMNSGGTGSYDPSVYVFASDILRSGLSDFYGGLVSFFISRGYVEGSSLFVFPYDFRLDNSVHLSELDSLVDQARSANASQKVILIAHSMGGLIATAYVNSDAERAAKVDSIVTMGTPFWGSPKCYYAITQGYTLGNIFVDLKQMKSMAVNWPAVYELLPRQPFITASNGGYLTLSQAFGVSYNAPYSNDRWRFNSAILSQAYSFDSLIGSPGNPKIPSSVKLYTIIGYGTQSLSGYASRSPSADEFSNRMTVNIDGNEVVLVPQFSDGDGTVQLWGAENSAATEKYYIWSDPKGESAAHAALPKNSKVQSIIWNIIDGKPLSSSSFSYNPSNGKLSSGEKIDLTVHSSANLQIFSNNNEMMGWNCYNGTIFEGLPQGIFLEQDGIQYASIQGSSNPFTVYVKGTETGSFALTANITNEGTTTVFSYSDVSVVNGTVAQLSINPTEVSSVLPPLTITVNQKTTNITPKLISRNGGLPILFWLGMSAIIVVSCLIAIIILRKFRR